MKFNTTTYILNLPHPRLKQSCLEGPFPMLWYVVKYKNNNKKNPNRTKQDKKPEGKWIPFVKELLLNVKPVEKKGGKKKKRKKGEHILQ